MRLKKGLCAVLAARKRSCERWTLEFWISKVNFIVIVACRGSRRVPAERTAAASENALLCDSSHERTLLDFFLQPRSMARRRKPSRDPGPQIREILRREVNFGCPIRHPDGAGCGSPILTFHHFDPPWAGCFEHNPDGMIALCPCHHLQADGGLWTNAQLREFKRHPFVDDRLKVRWPWQTETMVIKVGRSLVLTGGAALRFDGIPAVRFEAKEIPGLGIRTALLNSEIRDRQRQAWIQVADGWLDLRLENTLDVQFAPQTKTFVATHADHTWLSLRFRRPSVEAFQKWLPTFWSDPSSLPGVLQSIEDSGAIDSDGRLPLVVFEGEFTTDKVAISVKGNEIVFESLLPWMRERFPFKSHLVDGERRMVLHVAKGPEFFSLG